jgi:hypothetical protein
MHCFGQLDTLYRLAAAAHYSSDHRILLSGAIADRCNVRWGEGSAAVLPLCLAGKIPAVAVPPSGLGTAARPQSPLGLMDGNYRSRSATMVDPTKPPADALLDGDRSDDGNAGIVDYKLTFPRTLLSRYLEARRHMPSLALDDPDRPKPMWVNEHRVGSLDALSLTTVPDDDIRTAQLAVAVGAASVHDIAPRLEAMLSLLERLRVDEEGAKNIYGLCAVSARSIVDL